MAMNFIAAKGNLKPQQDVQQAMQDWANFLAQNKTNEATQQAEQKDPLRETINEIVLKKLSAPIEMPKYTTLQDVFNAQKGDKLNTFGEYLSTSPDAARLIGSFLGGTYIDRNGKFVHSGEKEAQERIAQMEKAQQQALEAEKQQGTLAGNMYDALNRMDIADMNDKRARELAEQDEKWARERFAQEMALKQLQLNSQISHQRAMEGIARDRLNNSSRGSSGSGIITGGASDVPNLNNIKMTAAERKQYTENKSTLANIDAGLKAFKKYPAAYGPAKGLLPASILNLTDPKGIDARAQIDNITAVYRKWLTGAQMSDKERKAYERFLPAPTDTREAIIRKLNSMKGSVQRSNEAILSNYGISSDGNNDPLGLGL